MKIVAKKLKQKSHKNDFCKYKLRQKQNVSLPLTEHGDAWASPFVIVHVKLTI